MGKKLGDWKIRQRKIPLQSITLILLQSLEHNQITLLP